MGTQKYITVKENDENKNDDLKNHDHKDKKEKNYKKERLKQKYILIPIVVLIITNGGYIWNFYYRYSLETERSRQICFYIVIICYINILLSYFLAINTKPKQTDFEKILFHEENNLKESYKNYQDNVIKKDFKISFCEFCQKKKFIRSSHCKMCDFCVLNRDHHCPWIANCVGFQNIQYFYNFLIWGFLDITTVIVFFFKFLYNISKIRQNFPELNLTSIKIIYLLLSTILIGIIDFNLLMLLCLLTYETYNNRSQLEGMRQINIEMFFPFKKYNDNKFVIYNMYNVGFLNHFYYSFGNTILHLIFPFPKFKDYNYYEECPNFNGCKLPYQLDMVKMKFGKKGTEIDNLLNSPGNEPSEFLKLSHQVYDGKHIH